MNICPNCKLPISGRNYRFCPSCREVISELEVQCPGKVFVGTSFDILISSKGVVPVSVTSITLDGTPLATAPLQVVPDDPIGFTQSLDNDGRHLLEVKSQGFSISRVIECRPLGVLSLIWQNNQTIQRQSIDQQGQVYVNRSIADRNVVPSDNTRLWINAAALSVRSKDGDIFEFQPFGNGFRIGDDFFDWVEQNEEVVGFISLTTGDGLLIEIPDLVFCYAPDLPNLRLIHSDYLNEIRLTQSNSTIKYTLTYLFDDPIGTRPIDKVTIKYHADFVRVRQQEKYFDPKQAIQERVEIDISRIESNTHLNDQVQHLGFSFEYYINGIDRLFSSFCDIPFMLRSKTDHATPQPSGFVMAVDFGTSNTCMATHGSTGHQFLSIHPHPFLTESAQMLPTVIKFDKLGDPPPEMIRIGEDLEDGRPPLTFAANFKPRLVKDEALFYYDHQLPRNTRHYKPSELMKLYLGFLKSEFESLLGHQATTTLISYPADFSSNTRSGIHTAFQSLGMETNQDVTLSEPENIALYFAMEPESKIRKKIEENDQVTLCVFDCGGGTTDVSVVRITSSPGGVCFDILATWGTDAFSGNYITYMLGKHIDGHEEWFPHDFSRLYTARNEELEEYFKRHQGYEGIKCGDIEKYCNEIAHASLKTEIMSKIRAAFELVKTNILKQLFDIGMIGEMDADFFILAGNSCKMSWFYEIALDEFYGSEVIWDPEKGKAAVVLGALLASQMGGTLEIRGMSLSKYEYFYRHGLDLRQVFRPLLNMDNPEYFTSDPLKPSDVIILERRFIDNSDIQPISSFKIPKPDRVVPGCKHKFMLQFHKKVISYCWIPEDSRPDEPKEFKEIHYEQ